MRGKKSICGENFISRTHELCLTTQLTLLTLPKNFRHATQPIHEPHATQPTHEPTKHVYIVGFVSVYTHTHKHTHTLTHTYVCCNSVLYTYDDGKNHMCVYVCVCVYTYTYDDAVGHGQPGRGASERHQVPHGDH